MCAAIALGSLKSGGAGTDRTDSNESTYWFQAVLAAGFEKEISWLAGGVNAGGEGDGNGKGEEDDSGFAGLSSQPGLGDCASTG
jgi:hypothetical protein